MSFWKKSSLAIFICLLQITILILFINYNMIVEMIAILLPLYGGICFLIFSIFYFLLKKHKYSPIILSSFGTTFIMGTLFKIQHWPGASLIKYHSFIVLLVGLITILIERKQNAIKG